MPTAQGGWKTKHLVVKAYHRLLGPCVEVIHAAHSLHVTRKAMHRRVTAGMEMLSSNTHCKHQTVYQNQSCSMCFRLPASGAHVIPGNPSSLPSIKARKLPPVASRYCPSLQYASYLVVSSQRLYRKVELKEMKMCNKPTPSH